jgi:hypothetical protein
MTEPTIRAVLLAQADSYLTDIDDVASAVADTLGETYPST